MDLSQAYNLISCAEPIEMPISELLEGTYHFSIPSYQRGYRWESKIGKNDDEVRQVDDLLNDLMHFVTNNANNAANYYLQPLMVKPWYNNTGELVWDVLDGQQRLTTMLLVLKCLNEKFNIGKKLYTISYENRSDIDFSKLTYNEGNPNYDYPKANKNLDSFYIRKAKDRIFAWFNDINSQQVKDKLKEALFYEDNSRDLNSNPNLRVKFIWYNASPRISNNSQLSSNKDQDIAIFNRLNGGKIGLTNSELLKALFLLCIKVDRQKQGNCFIDEETLVRKWDDMERKFQDNEFWNMISPKNKEYENRLDFLFDFIRESDNSNISNSYRYYYNVLKPLLTVPDSTLLEKKWEEVKNHFDLLCKWHENTTLHNYIGFLIEFGKSPASILREIKRTNSSVIGTVRQLIKNTIATEINNIDELRYNTHEAAIRKILVLFNIATSERHCERFSFNQYRGRSYDIEHINSQKDNAIVKPQERLDWIEEQALASLREDRDGMNQNHTDYATVNNFIKNGENLKLQKESIKQQDFDNYRQTIEEYYAQSQTSKYDKDWIGNLTLLNSAINREYKNALFPQKLRTIKRSDQEGEYIPPCTRYLFLKYYSPIKGSTAAFNMMRWNDEDQEEYTKTIKNTLKIILQ